MKRIFISLSALALACSKPAIDQPSGERLNKYQLIIDHYTQDSSIIERKLWWQAYLPTSRNGGIDTLKDNWFLNCDTWLIEHHYYRKNDQKIQSSKFPNQIPEKIDTNFNNYQKTP